MKNEKMMEMEKEFKRKKMKNKTSKPMQKE